MALTNIFIKNVKHTGATSGDKYTDGRVIRNVITGETFGGESCCEIEHLFYGQAATADFYHQEPCVGGTKVVFKSDKDKTVFAKEVVPTLDGLWFEPFRPVFEFIKSKCVGGVSL